MRSLRLIRALVLVAVALGGLGALTAGGLYLYLNPRLPSIDRLRDVQLQVPLRVFSAEGELIAEFGEKRRTPVQFDEVPEQMVRAFLAAEDDRFFEHNGVDLHGLARAAWYLVLTGEKRQGGSTITMQVARNFFLTREKTFLRKFNEILLALKIEDEISKQEILELYFNKIYLGQRAYGVAAAAQVYYGKSLDELTLAQIATIAGLPKAPSRDNPVVSPARARERRNYVLGRMHELDYITDAAYRQARAAETTAELHALSAAVSAPYVAEMVRSEMLERYGERAYTAGYTVYTTVDGEMQDDANRALRKALVEYDRRHGYRGPEAHVEIEAELEGGQPDGDAAARRDEVLADYRPVGTLLPALVTGVAEQRIEVYIGDGQTITVGWEGLKWARPHVSQNRRGQSPETAGDIVSVGDVVRVRALGEGAWRLGQIPDVQGALVALDPDNGAVRALVGGFDYHRSKFNRAIQARRQPGSSFKPFIYSAALDTGYTPATLINDAPVVFEDDLLESTWRPENYSGRFHGPTRMREALVHSRNLVSIRLLRDIGIGYAVDYVKRFGFPPDRIPRDLSMALGTASITPLELARGYAVFANGGYRIEPWYIDRIVAPNDEVVYEPQPLVACEDCAALTGGEDDEPAKTAPRPDDTVAEAVPLKDREAPQVSALEASGAEEGTAAEAPAADLRAPRVITPQNHYLMNTMLRDVIRRGTGRGARVLGRSDLAGKTGTTDDQRDAWFAGFNPELVAISWVGFDQVKALGNGETGARAALPMWIAFMGGALEGMPEQPLTQPSGLVTVRIDAETGKPTGPNNPEAVFETFRQDNVPRMAARGSESDDSSANNDTDKAPAPLF